MNKSTKAVMFSSSTGEHETPQDLFDQLNEEFHFNLDPCATAKNAKCKNYYTIKEDGLSRSWHGQTVFVNPPYGKGVVDWIAKAVSEYATVVMLLPARTDTKWFHLYIAKYASEVRFIKGRLRFVGTASSAPFPSMLVVFRPKIDGPYSWHTLVITD